ncbi:MAG: hypothetical protein HRT89_15265 [Lentisphaeria bacterium]|nr:hypothetical protein [Lentisphaeria bacterium]NQZ69416.1 hypothetical protein [Lentisphaeria bacterium]
MSDEPFYARNIEVDHLVDGSRKQSRMYQRKKPLSRIIKAEDVVSDENVTSIIGGEHPVEECQGPAIILEKKDDKIYRILVTCTCGSRAELLCEYDEDEEAEGGGEVDEIETKDPNIMIEGVDNG